MLPVNADRRFFIADIVPAGGIRNLNHVGAGVLTIGRVIVAVADREIAYFQFIPDCTEAISKLHAGAGREGDASHRALSRAISDLDLTDLRISRRSAADVDIDAVDLERILAMQFKEPSFRRCPGKGLVY